MGSYFDFLFQLNKMIRLIVYKLFVLLVCFPEWSKNTIVKVRNSVRVQWSKNTIVKVSISICVQWSNTIVKVSISVHAQWSNTIVKVNISVCMQWSKNTVVKVGISGHAQWSNTIVKYFCPCTLVSSLNSFSLNSYDWFPKSNKILLQYITST